MVFTERLVGAFKRPGKIEDGVEKRLASLGLCFPAFASLSADLDMFSSRLMTLSTCSRRQEVGNYAQGHSSF